MSFGADHRVWDAINAHVIACGGDPGKGSLDAILSRREVVRLVDEHVEAELEVAVEAANDARGPDDDDLISLPLTPSPLATVELVPG